MEELLALSKVFKFIRLFSDFKYQRRRNQLANLLEEKEKLGQNWAAREHELCLLAFDYLSSGKQEREDFQRAIEKSKEDLEQLFNRSLLLMLNFEDIAHVLIEDKQKALLAHSVAKNIRQRLIAEQLTMEEFDQQYTFLEIPNYTYSKLEDLIPAFARNANTK